VGGILAKYAAEGIETHLITATRGERGWKGKKEDYPGPEALGAHRTEELKAAAEVLGIRRVHFLDYMDGELDQVDPSEAVGKIVEHLEAVRPQVVVTFGPEGAYGHPDHIAISQFTAAAIVEAAHTHRVSKLYYMADTKKAMDVYQAAFGEVKKLVDGVERRFDGWEDWAVTTIVDTGEHVATVWRAIDCHRSQLRDYQKLKNLSVEEQRRIFETQSFYRAFSLCNGGRTVEVYLFAGLR
jgi:LmbE family N-acetylglucosaminyl deacetylase